MPSCRRPCECGALSPITAGCCGCCQPLQLHIDARAVPGRVKAMRHWILQANPRRYRLVDALRDNYEISSWSIAHLRKEIAPGDEFALWLSGEERGVYALGVVTEPAEYRPDDDDPYWTDPADASTPRLHVGIRLWQSLIDRPVLGVDLAEDPRFANALILRIPAAVTLSGSPTTSGRQYSPVGRRIRLQRSGRAVIRPGLVMNASWPWICIFGAGLSCLVRRTARFGSLVLSLIVCLSTQCGRIWKRSAMLTACR